jgi:hypothetical protein
MVVISGSTMEVIGVGQQAQLESGWSQTKTKKDNTEVIFVGPSKNHIR